VEVSQLAALFAEAVLYGFYLISLFFCLSTTYRFTLQSTGWKFLLIVTLVISILVTLNISLNLVRMVAIVRASTLELAPSSGTPQDLKNIYLQAALNGSQWQDMLRAVCIYLESALADAVLIWRCWAIYHKSLIIITVPVFLWVASLGVAGWSVDAGIHVATSGNQLTATVISYWSLTFSLNILTSGLIVYRLQRHERERVGVFSRDNMMDSMNRVKRIIIDSGLLYTVTTIPTLVTEVIQDTALHITSGMDIVVVGIAFNLILIRVGRLRKNDLKSAVRENPVLTTIQFNSSNTQGGSPSSETDLGSGGGEEEKKQDPVDS